MRNIFWIILLLIAMACSQEELPDSHMTGKWVEVTNGTDTLSFESFAGVKEIMVLARGLEETDGHIKPKRASGPYDYQIQDTHISLRWHLSSNSAFNDFYFDQEGDSLRIGNFYTEDAAGVISTFVRID